MDLEDAQAIVEVFPEFSRFHGSARVSVGGGYDPDVGLQGLGTSEALELPFLEHAQELGLDGEGHFSHFVEKKHASSGLLDLARTGLVRAGEGTPQLIATASPRTRRIQPSDPPRNLSPRRA